MDFEDPRRRKTYGFTHVSPRLPESGSRPNPAIVREREVGLIRLASHRHRLQHAFGREKTGAADSTQRSASRPASRHVTDRGTWPRRPRTLSLAATGASLAGGADISPGGLIHPRGPRNCVPKAASGRNSPAAPGPLGRLTGGDLSRPPGLTLISAPTARSVFGEPRAPSAGGMARSQRSQTALRVVCRSCFRASKAYY